MPPPPPPLRSLQKKVGAERESHINPWVIGFLAFVLVGSTVFQIINAMGKSIV